MVNRPRARRAHVIAGGFPPGSLAGHDHDYARLRLLELFEEHEDVHVTCAGDFTDVAKWLPGSRFLVTYVAGPYLDDEQNEVVREWLESGGRWLGLHGSSGGRAVRTPDGRRRMVKASHHDTLGAFFLNHPPVRRFKVDVVARDHPLTRGLPDSFETVDEPYMVEIQHPESTVLLTSELGPDSSPEGFGFVYDADTSLQPDGRTRVLGVVRDVGRGAVAYVALGHCHTPISNSQPFVDESVADDRRTPLTLRTTWETDAFNRLLANAIEWGLEAPVES